MNSSEASARSRRSLFGVLLERWRQTESQLRQSERMAQLGTLTAGLAHELNNPLTCVKGFAQKLTHHEDEKVAKFAQKITRSAQRIRP